MGASLSNSNKKTVFTPKPIFQYPIFLTSTITSQYLEYSDVRYLARDPFSHNFYISSPGNGETIVFSHNGKKSKIKHTSRFDISTNPYTFRPSFSICPLVCSPLMLISHRRAVAVCDMDGHLVTMIECSELDSEEQLIKACADSTSIIYTLSQVIRLGAVRGQITEISCQLTVTENFHFGANHIAVARDMCKLGSRLFVLHESEKCVLVFSVDGTLISALVSTLPRHFPNAIFNPMQMVVDSKQNIIISSWGEDTISLINSKGHIVSTVNPTSKVPFSKPTGLYLDELNQTLYCLTKGEQPQLLSIKIPSEFEMF